MWMHNRINEIAVQAYNESTTRGDGGLVDKSKSVAVTLCVLWLPPKRRYRHEQKGTHIVERARIQVSCKQLEDQNFTLITGQTHIIKDGNDYRVMNITDASYMKSVQLRECDLVRKIPMRNLN